MRLYDIVKTENAIYYNEESGAGALYDIDRMPGGGNYEEIAVEEVELKDIPREVLEVAAEGVAILRNGAPVKVFTVREENGEIFTVYPEF